MNTSVLVPSQLLEVFLGLIAVVGLIYLVAFLLKIVQDRMPGQENLQVLQSLPLSAKERLVLVDFKGEQILLGVSAGGVNRLATLSSQEQLGTPPARLATEVSL